jgi:prevent-host-death family protein
LAKSSYNSYYDSMQEITAKEAKNRFGQLLESAQRGPIQVTRNGRPVGVMMSVQQFERLRGAAWERLTATMDALGREASARGLTDAKLESLLADES